MHEPETLKDLDIMSAGAAVRSFGKQSKTLEELAGRITRYLYTTEQSAAVLVRFFYTLRYNQLEPSLQEKVVETLGYKPDETDKCLTLLGTAGEKDEWQHRRRSRHHQAIPLLSPEMVLQLPMISRLLTQVGVEISTLFRGDLGRDKLFLDPEKWDYNVFYVPEARSSPYIPAQDDFVIPNNIRSVVGFGSSLPTGEVYVVIMFFRVHVPHTLAYAFHTLALSTTIAVLSVPADEIFATTA